MLRLSSSPAYEEIEARPWRRRLVVLVTVCGALAAAAILRREAARTIGVEEVAASANVNDDTSSLKCSDFDDDNTFTEEKCRLFDVSSCNLHCADGWCLELCQDACWNGAGAICAVERLNNITHLCNSIDWHMKPEFSLHDSLGMDPYGTGATDTTGAKACDHHVYCRWCGTSCRHLLYEYSYGADNSFYNVGPHAMRILSNISSVCEGIAMREEKNSS